MLVAMCVFGGTQHQHGVGGGKEACSYGPLMSLWQQTAIESQRRFLIERIQNVRLYLATDSCGDDWDASVRHAYGPYLRQSTFFSNATTRVDKYRESVRLMRADSRRAGWPQFVILTRPDVLWHEPADPRRLLVDDGIVWPHRCDRRAWTAFECVSDVFISASLTQFDKLTKDCDDALFHKLLSSAHYTYQCALRRKIAKHLAFYGDDNLTVSIRTLSHANRIRNYPYFLPVDLDDDTHSPDDNLDLLAAKDALRRFSQNN